MHQKFLPWAVTTLCLTCCLPVQTFGAVGVSPSVGEVTTAQLNTASNAIVSLIGSGGGGTNFSGQLITNFVRKVVRDLGSTTNAVIAVNSTNSVVWSPASNCALTLSGSWTSGYRQVIDLTLVLTNGQTSVVLPLAGPGGAAVGLLTPPSTNALVIVSDGTRQWIESGVSAVNTNQFSSDGSSIKSWASLTNPIVYGTASGPASTDYRTVLNYFRWNGRQVLNEEFWGDSEADDRYGSEHWARNGNTGTAVWTNSGAGGFGVLAISPRTAGSGKGYGMNQAGGSALPKTFFTNGAFLCAWRVMASALDDATDTNVVRFGWAPSSILSEPSAQILWINTNNAFELVTSRSGVRTATRSASNWTANAWYQASWYMDSTGTNVYGYLGPNDNNMGLVATNVSNIPGDIALLAMLHAVRGLTNSTAAFTNYFDSVKLWSAP